MADAYGAGALTALVEELKLTKHTEKLAAAGVTTLRSLMALDDGGISEIASLFEPPSISEVGRRR